MQATQRTTVVGVFEDRRQADKAVSELRQAGFRDDQIGVAMRGTEMDSGTSTTTKAGDTYAGEGAIAGILTGLGLGALAGLGVLSGVIPVIGPAIAGGTLGVILSNAAVGGGLVGLVGALVGAGVPEEEATYYHEEFQAGRTIVTVTADGRSAEATTILRRNGAYDMSTRGTLAAGTATTSTTAASRATGMAAASSSEGDTIRLSEERLHAEKRPVEAGEVVVRKEVHTENKTIEVPVQREEVVIERTPVYGKAASGDIRPGEEVRVPVREEHVDVSKHAVVTEEVKVGKRVVQDTETVAGDVRKEQVKVERKGDVDVRTGGTGHTPK
jgi:uncharacterized protein (TIGR02271 family)